MLYRMHKPSPPLAPFVRVIWYHEGEPKPHAKERLLPDGSVELVVNLFENRIPMYGSDGDPTAEIFPGSIVCGPRSRYFVIDTASQEKCIGVHFRPGGAYAFLGPSCAELSNHHWSLEDLWGGEARTFRERLLEAPSVDHLFGVVENTLIARAGCSIERDPAVNYAVHLIQQNPHAVTIGNITGQIGMTAKRFIESFKREVGLTPKVFCRVRRFQRVIQAVHNARPVDWSSVAMDCGYFDQAHFIHDFRSFSGMSPSAYLARRTEHMNHVPLV